MEEEILSNTENVFKEATPLDFGGVKFTDPDGNMHELPIIGYHVLDSKSGYLLVIGNEKTEEFVSSKDFTILKFEENNINSIPTKQEYEQAADIFQKELARQFSGLKQKD